MDDFEVDRAIREAQERVRCINCFYYEKEVEALTMYANCRIKKGIKRFDDYCAEWATSDWQELITTKTQEQKMSNGNEMLELLIEELERIDGITIKKLTSGIRINHDSNLPEIKVEAGQNGYLSVYLKLYQRGKPPALLSIRHLMEALDFVEWVRISIKLRSRRKI